MWNYIIKTNPSKTTQALKKNWFFLFPPPPPAPCLLGISPFRRPFLPMSDLPISTQIKGPRRESINRLTFNCRFSVTVTFHYNLCGSVKTEEKGQCSSIYWVIKHMDKRWWGTEKKGREWRMRKLSFSRWSIALHCVRIYTSVWMKMFLLQH